MNIKTQQDLTQCQQWWHHAARVMSVYGLQYTQPLYRW